MKHLKFIVYKGIVYEVWRIKEKDKLIIIINKFKEKK